MDWYTTQCSFEGANICTFLLVPCSDMAEEEMNKCSDNVIYLCNSPNSVRNAQCAHWNRYTQGGEERNAGKVRE